MHVPAWTCRVAFIFQVYINVYSLYSPGSTLRYISDPVRPILFCSLDPSKHEKWMPPSPNWDELPVWRHFQNGRHENWQNHVFAYNSASNVDRNEISGSTPIFFRVRNSIKAFAGFYDFNWLIMNYLCDVIFKMATTNIGEITFLIVTQLLG